MIITVIEWLGAAVGVGAAAYLFYSLYWEGK